MVFSSFVHSSFPSHLSVIIRFYLNSYSTLSISISVILAPLDRCLNLTRIDAKLFCVCQNEVGYVETIGRTHPIEHAFLNRNRLAYLVPTTYVGRMPAYELSFDLIMNRENDSRTIEIIEDIPIRHNEIDQEEIISIDSDTEDEARVVSNLNPDAPEFIPGARNANLAPDVREIVPVARNFNSNPDVHGIVPGSRGLNPDVRGFVPGSFTPTIGIRTDPLSILVDELIADINLDLLDSDPVLVRVHTGRDEPPPPYDEVIRLSSHHHAE